MLEVWQRRSLVRHTLWGGRMCNKRRFSIGVFNMAIRFDLRVTCLLFLSISFGTLCGQAKDSGADGRASLRQHYITAQELQRAGKLNEAAKEYRAFLADALDE